MRNRFVAILALGFLACGTPKEKSGPKEEPKKTPAPASAPAPVASKPAGTAPAATTPAATAPEVKVSLTSKEVPPIPDSDAPRSKVTLTITESGKAPTVQELGEFLGCGTGAEGDPGALLSVTCFWAGAGDNFYLYQEKDALVLKYVAMDEEMKDKPVPVEKFRYPLPPNAVVKKE